MQKPHRIILGSQSPRRLEILKQVGFDVQVVIPSVEENFPQELDNYKVPEFLSLLKLEKVSTDLGKTPDLIICADTVVIFNNQLLGKPKNEIQAFELLKMMNGKSHDVVTGVSMQYKDKRISFSEHAKVFFKTLQYEEIKQYIATYNTLDKAGAYNIQEYFGVERLEGEFFNVMGLPVSRVLKEIEQW